MPGVLVVTYIVARYEPTATAGKYVKKPADWRTGRVANALDPAIWTDRATAEAAAAAFGPDYGLGLVITQGTFFLDIDNCLQADNVWSPVAVDLCQRFAGCYIEVSKSGRGLHIIGRGSVAAHATRNGALGLELYTRDRFCALTGTYAVGNMDHDAGAVLATLAAQYFAPSAAATEPAEWTDGPCEGWAGPADDDELIRRALASTSAAAAFGGKPTFRQLWEVDVDALARAFPDTGDRAYDASRADASLAQHLAFWTGRDCERMERLMRASGLERNKYDRPDYLPATITRACGQQREVARGRSEAVAVTATTGTTTTATATASPGLILASDYDAHFNGCVYIEDRYAAAVPDGSILAPQQFRSNGRYGGHRFVLDDNKTTRNAWEAFAEAEVWRPAFAHSVCFRPELPPRSLTIDAGRVLFNSYVPIDTACAPGDIGPFERHMALLFPDARDRAWILAYMARAVQSPGVKLQWAPLIQGVEGNGKTFLIRVMVHCVGERYAHMCNAQDLANKFNSWIEGKLFIGVEEIYISDRRDAIDTLKNLITNRRIEIQAKGQNQITGDNRANFMLTTNYRDAIMKTDNDRRYGVFYTAQQESSDLARDGMTGSYFPNLYKWFDQAGGAAAINHHLRTYAIPAEMDPAGLAHRAPVTSSTAAAIEESRPAVEQAVLEAIATGETGFRGGWVSSNYLAQLIERVRPRSVAPMQFDKLMQALGYVKHPALSGGRTNNEVAPDMKKARLWVKRDSISALNHATGAAVATAYTVANAGLAQGVAAAG